MIELRPLQREDFGLLAAWLAEPTDVFVAKVGGEPFGIIQRNAISAYPSTWRNSSHCSPSLPRPCRSTT
jgi:hypothetical protein